MFLRLFKGTGPGTIILIVITLLLVWASSFFNLKDHFSLYFDLYPMPLYGILSSIIGTNPFIGIIFTLLLVTLMAFLMVNLNTTIFFINKRTLLPAIIYILFSGFFPQYQLLNPAIFAAMFLMLAIRRIMEAYRAPGVAYNFFDAAVLISIGSLFYANLIWFGLLLIVGMALLRTGSLIEIFISFLGLLTPYFLTFGIYYVTGNDLGNLTSLMVYNFIGKPDSYVFTQFTLFAIVFVGLIISASMIHMFMLLNTKKIKSRKTFFLLSWLFIISILAYFVLPAVSVEIVWIAGIPVSFFLTHYFVFAKGKLIPEFIFSGLYIIILVIQIMSIR